MLPTPSATWTVLSRPKVGRHTGPHACLAGSSADLFPQEESPALQLAEPGVEVSSQVAHHVLGVHQLVESRRRLGHVVRDGQDRRSEELHIRNQFKYEMMQEKGKNYKNENG